MARPVFSFEEDRFTTSSSTAPTKVLPAATPRPTPSLLRSFVADGHQGHYCASREEKRTLCVGSAQRGLRLQRGEGRAREQAQSNNKTHVLVAADPRRAHRQGGLGRRHCARSGRANEEMAARIQDMRALLKRASRSGIHTKGCENHITDQIGMFAYTGLTKERVQQLAGQCRLLHVGWEDRGGPEPGQRGLHPCGRSNVKVVPQWHGGARASRKYSMAAAVFSFLCATWATPQPRGSLGR